MIEGRLPPQSLEAERAVLGAILIDQQSIVRVIGKILPEYFYHEGNGLIFKAMLEMNAKLIPIDMLTVTNQLKQAGNLDLVGGPYYISSLTDGMYSSGHIENHSLIILQAYIKRKVIEVGIAAVNDGFSDVTDVDQVLENIVGNIFQLNGIISGLEKRTKPIQDVLKETIKKIEQTSADELIGIPTGNPRLDKILGGWIDGELIILAARPGIGKTARMLECVRAAAMAQKKSIVFSLEMKSTELVQRILSNESNVEGWKLRTGDIHTSEWGKINEGSGRIYDMDVFIDDSPGLTITQIRSIAKLHKVRHGLDIIFIDYLQLIGSPKSNKNREQEVAEISKALKNMAKELDVPVICLSQLSRDVEKQANKRPNLSSLRESGAIEQDADIVLGLYRPSYYYDYDSDPDVKANAVNWTADLYPFISEIIPLKFRGGDSSKYVTEYFHGQFSRFNSEYYSDYSEYKTEVNKQQNERTDDNDPF